MARRAPMQRLARWHIWLGWAAALPLILWTASGLFMTLRPIDEVRGTDLRNEPLALPESILATTPAVNGWPVRKMTLFQRVDGPVWIIERDDGSIQTSSVSSGAQLQGVSAQLAQEIANAALKSPAKIVGLRRFEADANPIDLRRDRPAWQVAYTDGLRVYVDADTGEVLALRSSYWRAYDFMWGLHIMDPLGRENTSHALLWLFSVIALASSLLGTTLLFRRRRAAR